LRNWVAKPTQLGLDSLPRKRRDLSTPLSVSRPAAATAVSRRELLEVETAIVCRFVNLEMFGLRHCKKNRRV